MASPSVPGMEATASIECPPYSLTNEQKPGGCVRAQSLIQNESLPRPEPSVTQVLALPLSLLSYVNLGSSLKPSELYL